jgi:hypothetical protein
MRNGAPGNEKSIRAELARAAAQVSRVDIKGAGTFVLALAFRQCRTAMPAGPRRYSKFPCGDVAALLIAGEVDDVTPWHYDFLNHCCPHGLRQRYRRKPSHKRSAQRSNFSGEIEAAVDQRAIVFLTFARKQRDVALRRYNHFFHLKMR